MQMKKTIGIFLAVCFLMSVTAAAVSADPRNDRDIWQKTKAVDDMFKLSAEKNTGNVLKNDIGKDLKVIKVSLPKKGKLSIGSKGFFKYTPFKSRDKTIIDSFRYTIKGENGKSSSAKVTIIFENKKTERDDNRGGDVHPQH